MIFKILSFFDLFPQTVNFYYRGTSKQSSGIGILVSFCIYALMIFSVLENDIFEKKSPIVVSQSLKTPEARKIQFDENWLIAFSVNDYSKKAYNDPSIFNIKFQYRYNATHFEYKDLHICSLEDVAFNTTIFDTLNLNNFYCLKNKSFILDGSFEETHVSYISVSLFLCNNSTSNGTCKSQEQIDDFFNGWSDFKFFGVHYHNSQIDFSDYDNPFKQVYKTDYQLVDTSIKKRFNIYLKTAEVLTDDALIFSSEKVSSDIMFDSKEFDFQMRSDKAQPVFQMLFFASKELVKCTRRYKKLPDILGSVAGTMQFIMIFCKLITKLVIYVSTLNYITNKLYYFPDMSNQRGEKKEKKKLININTINNLNSIIKRTSIMKNKKMEPSLEIKDLQLKNMVSNFKEPTNEEKKNSADNFFKNLKQDSFVLEHFSEENQIPIDLEKNLKTDDIPFKESKKIDIKNQALSIEEIKITKLKKKPKKKTNLFYFLKKKKVNDSLIQKKNVKNNFNMSWFEYLIFFFTKSFFKNTPKKQIILETEKAFMNDMDIVNIVTKLHDLEKLKVLLLNEDQLVLFKYLSKPIITADDENNKQNEINFPHIKMSCLMGSKLRKRNKIEESYKKVFADQNSDKINRKMIELLDERVRKWEKKS